MPKETPEIPELRHGRIIPCQRHFKRSFHHLGKKNLRQLLSTYGAISCDTVQPHEMLEFIALSLLANTDNAAWRRRLQVVDDVLSAMIFLRTYAGSRFSLRSLNENLSILGITRLADHPQIPRPLHDSLVGYLNSLPEYRNSRLFNEPVPLRAMQVHTEVIGQIRSFLIALSEPSLAWIKDEIKKAEAWIMSGPQGFRYAYQIVNDVREQNLRYHLMTEEDLHYQLSRYEGRLHRLPYAIKDQRSA